MRDLLSGAWTIQTAAPACNFDRATFVAQVNTGYLSIFCNWYSALRAVMPDVPVVILAYGERTALGAEGIVQAHGVGTSQTDIVRANETGVSQTSNHKFTSPAFNRIANDKVGLLIDSLQRTRKPVIFTDIDTAFIQDPRPLLSSKGGARGNHTLIALRETERSHCTCFVAACAAPSALRFLHSWRDALSRAALDVNASGEARNEQVVFHGEWAAHREAGWTTLGDLTTHHLPSGHGHARGIEEGVSTASALRPSHVWVHANWIEGAKNKQMKLLRQGHWNASCMQHM
mmetsp:Transcript_59217/g.135851  ORF Transcript_59217/g.135851 Transcript_59217/m.135851 type:complete len:288 (-) Transcript_59217:71-934(-)